MKAANTLVLVLVAGMCDNKHYLIETTNTTEGSDLHKEAGADYNNYDDYEGPPRVGHSDPHIQKC